MPNVVTSFVEELSILGNPRGSDTFLPKVLNNHIAHK